MNVCLAGQLKIAEESGGVRHYLDDQPIHAGDVLEYFDMARDTWIPARFELAAGQRGRNAYLCLPGGQCLAVTETVRLRWSPIL